MEILLLVILNVGIVALLLGAFVLLRGSRSRSTSPTDTPSSAPTASRPPDRRRVDRPDESDRRASAERIAAGDEAPSTRDESTGRGVHDGVEPTIADAEPTPEAISSPWRSRVVAAPPDSLDLTVDTPGRPTPTTIDLRTDADGIPQALRPGRWSRPFRASEDLFAVDRPALLERDPSRIRVTRTASLRSPERAALVGGVMRTLGSIGLDPAEVDGRRSRLATADGRRAAINVDRLDDGVDVIDVIVDASLAADALRALTAWHRDDLDTTDGVDIRAWAG